MNEHDEDLQYLEPYFLEDLGFKKRQQCTSDSVRSVEWVIPVPSDNNETRHEISVLYELNIYDDPSASYTDNLGWFFDGVYLKTISLKKRKRYELFRLKMDGIYEDSDDFLNDGTLARTNLPIRTRRELEDFVKKRM